MSISKLFAFTLCTIVGLTSVVSAKTPKPRKLPAAEMAVKRAAATPAGLQIADKPEKLSLLDEEYVWSQKIDSSVRFVDSSLLNREAIDSEAEVVIVIEHPTSAATEEYQLELDRDRARSVMTKNCAKNAAGQCRWVRILTEANNTVGYVRLVKPQKLVALGTLVAKMDELTKDTDKDGVYDKDDVCKTVPKGPNPDPTRNGCPDEDTDKDTLLDHYGDACPTEAGPVENHGCPVTTTEKPAPAAVAAPAPAPEAPKAAPAKAADKKVFFNVMADVGTEVTVSTPGTVQFGIGFGVCATGSRLNQEIQVGGRVVSKPWYICPTLVLGDQARNYNRNGMDAHHVRVELRLSALTGGRGLNVAGTAPRDRMSANGAFLGPMVEGIVTQALLENNRFLAVYGALAGAEFKGRLGVFTIGVDVAPVGVCSVSKPGYTAGALGQPKAEYCLKAGANLGLTF
jgi:hypothetical protein